jgi:primosomal protein N' (replication factor Y)
MKIAEVLVFRGIDTTYTYKIPSKNASLYEAGHHIDIPFGKSLAEGVILHISEEKTDTKTSSAFKIKSVGKIIENKPQLSSEIINLINWFSKHYLVTPYTAYQTIMGNINLRKLEEPEKTETAFFHNEFNLNKDQKITISQIMQNGFGQKYLLFGVTGSGKTEIYIQIANEIIKQGKNVFILLPEIALTPQARKMFKKRFGEIVAVIHSGFTPKEREITWTKIYKEKIKIVIGPRSAIFCPLKNIGLIVIDEEHEPSYKQENHPRYFLHNIAEYRAAINNSILIFGSATPSLELYYEIAQKSASLNQLLKLEKRVENQSLPQVRVIDMREQNSHKSFISDVLSQKIKEKLEKQEKIIILINRRGYATYIICQNCQTILTCPQCDLSYTFHKDQKFRCHRCDTEAKITHVCPKCHKTSLEFSGLGIQKAELELKKQFPAAQILRLDKDNVKSAKALESMLEEFKNKADILIGTQIIAKGHHFADVTLVGVLGIDTILNMPDYKSPERVFQLLTQVAGRAGRSAKSGEVIVQTCQPHHPAIKFASNHDYEGFYKSEIAMRKELWYPPFSHLINIIISSQNEKEIIQYVPTLEEYLKTNFKNIKGKIQLIGPKPAPFEKIKTYFRWNILIKHEPKLGENIKKIIKTLPPHKSSLRVIIDLDPKSIL